MRHFARSLMAAGITSTILVGWIAGTGATPGRHAFASESALIEVRETPQDEWSQTAPGIWSMENAAPGAAVTGSVYLRRMGSGPEEGVPAVRITVSAEGPNPAPVLVTKMRLGTQDLSGAAPATRGAGPPCAVTVTTPIPVTNDGVPFGLTIVFDPLAGNALQGAAMDGLRVTFEATIGAASTASPSPTVAPTATPGTAPSSSPSPAATPATAPLPTEAPAPPGETPSSSLPLPRPIGEDPQPGEPRPGETMPPTIETPTPAGQRPPWPPSAGSGGVSREWSPGLWPLLAGTWIVVVAMLAWAAMGRRRR